MAARETKFVDVILPLAIPKTYTYRVPHDWNDDLKVGVRVIVQFGKGRKQYSAVVENIHTQPPKHYEAKYLESILDELPIVSDKQIDFWKWLASYYMATIGEVMNSALPAGLRLASETKVFLHPDYRFIVEELSDQEYLIVEALELRNELDLKQIGEILGLKNVQLLIKQMIEKKAIMVEEEIKRRYAPKMIDIVQLTNEMQKESKLKAAFNNLEAAPKQLEVLMNFIQLNKSFDAEIQEVRKLELQKRSNATSATINQLVNKGIFEIHQREAGRIQLSEASRKISKLSDDQNQALQSIQDYFKKSDVVLFHGVTSSGKTEIYMQLIRDAIKKGKQVLYLLPEIALTTQIVMRLQNVFGEKVGVYHSKFNENERVEVWNNVMAFEANKFEQFQIILGARSALFLPFQELGLVIVDEEHERTFKQIDPAPRYHARDAAIVLAKRYDAKVLLGSATPSLESMHNVETGKYAYVRLDKRYGNISLPEIIVADIKEATKRKKMKSHFSPQLLDLMGECLADKKQIILFQNRRGYSPYLLCETCGHAPQCIHCDVSLTYHKFKQRLNCHYCGYSIPLPKECDSCGDNNLHLKGFGTEKIEEEISIFFPEAKVARMDLDTTRAKKAYHQIINSFQEKEIDVLVGTQMVTKGLDFDHVGLVGILNADNLLYFPDFRAFERSYQLMSQVSGRAGRKGKRGKVLIQTFNPDHRIIQQVVQQDFASMKSIELKDRMKLHYPPYYRLIQLNLKHRDRNKTVNTANRIASLLKDKLGTRILGPEAPTIERIRNQYHQNILIKAEKNLSISKLKEMIQILLVEVLSQDIHKSVRVNIDVDPY